jgi:integrase/recombinase XerD
MLRDFITKHSRDDPIFGINRHRAWQIVGECAKRAGLPALVNPETGKTRGVSPHRLRDAFAVHAVKLDDSGDGLRLLQEHLGHASFNTTAKYRKVAGEEQRQWYEKLWHEAQGEVARPSGDFPRLGHKGIGTRNRKANKGAGDETKIAVQLGLF